MYNILDDVGCIDRCRKDVSQSDDDFDLCFLLK